MWDRALNVSVEDLLLTALLVGAVYLAVVLYARLTGLRSFSKMSATDFAMTVAVGSMLASAADPDRALPVALVGLATLFAGQWILAKMRTHWSGSQKILDNDPLLLMTDGEILHENLRQADVTLDDLYAKLREANVLQHDQVRAVVFETTGDISVLHSDDPATGLEPEILHGVRDRDRLGGEESAARGSARA